MNEYSVTKAVSLYLRSLRRNRKPTTVRTYKRGVNLFLASLAKRGVDPNKTPISLAAETWVLPFINELRLLSSSTQHVYVTAVRGWYKHIVQEHSASIDLDALDQYFSTLPRKPSKPSRPAPTEEAIARLIQYASGLEPESSSIVRDQLITLRDKAIVLTLADGEIQLERLCELKRSDAQWSGGIASIPSNGAILNLSRRASDALNDYLDARLDLDLATGKGAADLSLFSRHDKGAGSHNLRLSSTSIRSIVKGLAVEALGPAEGPTITPRAIRDYSLVSILRRSLASLHPKIVHRCRTAFETGQYDDAIFNAMKVVEEEVRAKANLPPDEVGVKLISKAMSPASPLLRVSKLKSEQESAYYLYRGSIGSFKNPLSHRYLDTSDPLRTYECLALGSLLMRILDEIK